MHHSGEHIWIIGASSGIGEALARLLASEGAHVTLSARNVDALERLARELPPANALPLDVADFDAFKQAAAQAFSQKLTRVIFLAALYDPMPLAALHMEKVKSLLEVNLLGAFHLVNATLPLFAAQGGGQLAICGSVAGFTGLPNGQPYSASKAGVIKPGGKP